MALNIIVPETRPAEINEELNTYEQNYSKIRRNIGKHVLIQGSTIVDYYDSYKAAINVGYEMFGLGNFLVREVQEKETASHILRCGVRPVAGPLKLVNKKAKKK